MTYFGFLLRFLVIPILLLLILAWRDHGWRRGWLRAPGSRTAGIIIGSLVLIALVYTTPWDNYLVANGIWWYDPALVTGITLGWVPIEEYTFFVLQPIMTCLWTLYLMRHFWPLRGEIAPSPAVRWVSTVVLLLVWGWAVKILVDGWAPGTYVAITLAWAIPPLLLQLALGGDVLWRQRTLVGVSILSATLYLAAADWLAIRIGIWTIDPAQSLNIFLGGTLPVEEFLFFLLTNTLVVFGLILGMAAVQWPTLRERVRPIYLWLGRSTAINRS
ncbi:MAG: lycopene cyclase domain-containing protein [Caldilineaceae bacterium]